MSEFRMFPTGGLQAKLTYRDFVRVSGEFTSHIVDVGTLQSAWLMWQVLGLAYLRFAEHSEDQLEDYQAVLLMKECARSYIKKTTELPSSYNKD